MYPTSGMRNRFFFFIQFNKMNKNGYNYSGSIIVTGVDEALQQVEIDWTAFLNRYKKQRAICV
jgi:hypothetical protein